jgi:U-box domain
VRKKSKDAGSNFTSCSWQVVIQLGNAESACGMETTQQVPAEFLCPISKRIMQDPVWLETGVATDRQYAEAYLRAGHDICPVTGEKLALKTLQPVGFLKGLITRSASHSHAPLGISPTRHCLTTVSSCPLTDCLTNWKQHRSLGKTKEKGTTVLFRLVVDILVTYGTSAGGRRARGWI